MSNLRSINVPRDVCIIRTIAEVLNLTKFFPAILARYVDSTKAVIHTCKKRVSLPAYVSNLAQASEPSAKYTTWLLLAFVLFEHKMFKHVEKLN